MDPAEIIRTGRVRAGLTQQELAVRAGTTKTAISRLERRHVSPSVDTLERLLLCMGYRLDVEPVALSPRTDPAQLDAFAGLEPTQRLNHALESQSSLAGLFGAAREH